MKITVDGEGRVTPEGAAVMMMDIGETHVVPRGGQIPDYKVAKRKFECTECKALFDAPAGQATKHECDELTAS